jgi:hypothetical protein
MQGKRVKYTCEWYDDAKTILLIRALMHLDWDDIYNALVDQMAHVESVSHGVYTIYELTLSPTLPKGVALTKLKRVSSERRPNQRLTLYVGMGELQRQMMEVTKSAFNLKDLFQNFYFVQTIDEALMLIDTHKQQSENV